MKTIQIKEDQLPTVFPHRHFPFGATKGPITAPDYLLTPLLHRCQIGTVGFMYPEQASMDIDALRYQVGKEA